MKFFLFLGVWRHSVVGWLSPPKQFVTEVHEFESHWRHFQKIISVLLYCLSAIQSQIIGSVAWVALIKLGAVEVIMYDMTKMAQKSWGHCRGRTCLARPERRSNRVFDGALRTESDREKLGKPDGQEPLWQEGVYQDPEEYIY